MVLDRRLQNQDDIGDSIQSYYGEETGNQFSKLLREHIVLAGQVVDTAKSGNKTLKDMLYTHLQLITDAVTARLNQDWQSDIMAYDKGEDHMIKCVEILVEGIIKQFPKQFK